MGESRMDARAHEARHAMRFASHRRGIDPVTDTSRPAEASRARKAGDTAESEPAYTHVPYGTRPNAGDARR